MRSGPAVATRSAGSGHAVRLLVALALTGFSLRLAVTSVGAALSSIEDDLHLGGGLAGLLTTLPVICFAAMGALAPLLGTRLGAHRALVAALVVSVVGLVTRALAGDVWLLLALSVLALAGGAVANVLLPSLVKLHFPERVGTMTAVYVTALSVGTTAAAGLTVPVGDLGDGWRLGIGVWALFPALAVVPWLPQLRRERATAVEPATHAPRSGAAALVRSRTAWALTLFFAAQSAIAYIGFGWMARFLGAHGIADSTAGAMVAVFTAVSIPVTMAVPLVPHERHRMLVLALVGFNAVAFAGLGIAPVGGAWFWMVAFGVGSCLFPVALILIGLRSRTAETTAAVSAFTQSIGYVIAGSGPLLFGVLHGATGGWALPLSLLWIALAIAAVSGWFAAAPRFVDDDLPAVPA